jgi:hypothetical protein
VRGNQRGRSCGAVGSSIAPALETAAAVIIPPPWTGQPLDGPKSISRRTALPTTATIADINAGIQLCLSFPSECICRHVLLFGPSSKICVVGIRGARLIHVVVKLRQ